jgi:hypothetical protein
MAFDPGEWEHIGYTDDLNVPGFQGDGPAQVFVHRHTNSLGIEPPELREDIGMDNFSSHNVAATVAAEYAGFTESPGTIRGGVLDEAKGLIEGDRNKTYGSPTQNFQNTADMWTALLRHKLKDGEVIAPYEVATLMVALKLARTVAQPKRDNFTDIAGYAACGYETIEDTK